MPPFCMVFCPAQVSSMHHGFLQWYVSHRPIYTEWVSFVTGYQENKSISYLVLAFTIKSKFIGWFAIRHLVYFEPVSSGMDQARHMLFHIFNICCIESKERDLVKLMRQISPHYFYHSTCRQEDHVNQWPGPSNRFLLRPAMPWYPMLSLAWLRLVYQRMNQFRIHQSDHYRHVLAYPDV